MLVRCLFVTGLLAVNRSVSDGQDGSASAAVEVLYWRDANGNALRATGLLYRPEVLSSLIGRTPDRHVPDRIKRAVEERTPILIMWKIASDQADTGSVGPYHSIILDTKSGRNIKPVWETDDPREVSLLDDLLARHDDVGIVAAFPQTAFQRGRVAVIFAERPDDPSSGAHRRVQVFGEFRETRSVEK